MTHEGVEEIRFRLSPEAFRAWTLGQLDGAEYQSQITKDRWRGVGRSVLLLPVWPLAAIGVWDLGTRLDWISYESYSFAWFFAICMGLGATVIAGSKGRYALRYRQQLERHATQNCWPGVLGDVVLRVSSTGFEYSCGHQQSRLGWPELVDIEHNEHGVAMTLSSGRSIMIPALHVQSDHSPEKINEIIRRHWNTAGASDERTRRFLKDHDLSCAKCGYSLRGVAKSSCPECGRTIEIEDLMRATTPAPQTPTGSTPASSSTRSA